MSTPGHRDPQFVGWINPGAILNPHADSDEFVLEDEFGWLNRDGIMLVCTPGSTPNGASIPRLLWPMLGHPISGRNRVWSTPHDCGYHGTAVYIDTMHPLICKLPAAEILRAWDGLPRRVRVDRPSRLWHDRAMMAGMAALRERAWKCAVCYAGVRIGGRRGWVVDPAKILA